MIKVLNLETKKRSMQIKKEEQKTDPITSIDSRSKSID
jgi:hypothetical protein